MSIVQQYGSSYPLESIDTRAACFDHLSIDGGIFHVISRLYRFSDSNLPNNITEDVAEGDNAQQATLLASLFLFRL